MPHTTKLFIANAAYKLKLRRLSLQLTLGDVSADTGKKLSALCRLESGAHKAELDMWFDLLDYYKLPREHIFTEYTTMPTHSQWQHLNRMSKALIHSRRWKEKKVKRKRKLKDVVI